MIGIPCMHIVWNVHFEAASLREKEEGSGGGGVTFRHIVKGLHGTKRLKTTILGH